MKSKLLAVLAKAINAYLRLDLESHKRMTKLRDKTITIEFLPFHFTFQCLFHEDSVELQTDELLPTDTKIRGTPLQLLGVMLAKDTRHRFFAEDLIIEGNAEFGQQVVQLFDEIQIDWEDYLSRYVGDAPAYQVGRFVRGISGWFRNTETAFSENVNEYLHEEALFLPSSEALQDFFSEIDTLRMDADRIEAKINHLRAFLLKDEVKQ